MTRLVVAIRLFLIGGIICFSYKQQHAEMQVLAAIHELDESHLDRLQPRRNLALAANGATITGADLGGPTMIDGKAETGEGTYARLLMKAPCLITLRENCELSEIRLRLVKNRERYYQYLIEVSPDGHNFEVVADARNGEHRDWQVHQFTARPVRYIRITGTYASTGRALYLHELEAYGSANAVVTHDAHTTIQNSPAPKEAAESKSATVLPTAADSASTVVVAANPRVSAQPSGGGWHYLTVTVALVVFCLIPSLFFCKSV
jgi:hypothetical protein